jgi:hypothetical protein
MFTFITYKMGFCQNLLNNPESVLFDEVHNRYLVSNYGGREIIQVGLDETQTIFYSGLPAPRGMIIYDNALIVVSDTGITGHDLTTGNLIWLIEEPPWIFPNDVTTDSSGYLYITDYVAASEGGSVYRIKMSDHSWDLYAGNLSYPNGLIYDWNGRLLVCGGWPVPKITSISIPDAIITTVFYPDSGGLDGIVLDRKRRVYVSSWRTQSISMYDPLFQAVPELVIDNLSDPADISYNTLDHSLLIPNFSSNSLDIIPINDFLCGDVNDDFTINIQDITYLIKYKYKNGISPIPHECIGDVNADLSINIKDITSLIKYKYKDGDSPGENCCEQI